MTGPRIRSLKPENWADEAVGKLTHPARLLRDVLITLADDDGRWRHLPSAIIGHGYPHDEEVTPRLIRKWANELVDVELIFLYEVDGQEYGVFPKWHVHQYIQRYSPSRLPINADVQWVTRDEGSVKKKGRVTDKSGTPPVVVREDSVRDQEVGVGFPDPDPSPVVEIDARANGERAERLQRIVTTLRKADRLTFDPDCVGVANVLDAFAGYDHDRAAHLAVSRAADPSWRTQDAARTLEYVLKGMKPDEPSKAKKDSSVYDRALGLTA